MSTIHVNTRVYSNKWHINKVLKELEQYSILGFDTETKGIYSKKERKEAKEYLKQNNIPIENKRIALQIAENCGLSFPSLISVTHFVFGLTEDETIILICDDPKLELYIWNWIATYPGLFLIHNTLYDLKIMYHRLKMFPIRYEDTQILAKCLTNNVDVWRSKVGLKDLMGSYYDPSWSLFEEYEPDDLKDPKFINYAGIDGAATVKLWNDIQEYIENHEHS